MYDVVISMIFYDIGLEGEHITIYEIQIKKIDKIGIRNEKYIIK